MRIFYFSRDYTTHDRRFLAKIAEHGHGVFFLRLEDDGILYEKRPLPEGVQLVTWQGGQNISGNPDMLLQLMPEFESILQRIRPDLVQAGPVQTCGFMTAISGFHPFLLVSWGSDILVDADRDALRQWMTCYTLQRSDMFLCDCQAVRQKAQQIFPYPEDQIIQFPWGVDLNMFSPGHSKTIVRKRPRWENAFIVLSTRSWESIYGIDILLNAFRTAYTENPRLRLVLLGDGPLALAVEQFIVEHALNDVIFRPGMISHTELPDYLRASNLYVSCSYSDGTSISLLEAMATGVPVVVTDAPANREWVSPGVNGWLAPAGKSDHFADYLLQCSYLKKRDLQKISQSNRTVTESRANWDHNIEILMNAYRELGS